MSRYKSLKNILAPVLQRLNNIKNFSTSIELVGKNFLNSTDFSNKEIKSLLWTAIDLKKQLCQNCLEVDNIKSVRVTLLMHEPYMEIQGSAMSATNLLQANLNVVIDPIWDNQLYIEHVGKFFSTCSDIIFCQSKYHSKIVKLAEGATIPVVNVRSCTYAILDTLADVMAIQEKYGHLKDLRLGWIGRPCPLFNTYLCIVPRLGVNIQFYCACSPGANMSPAKLPLGKQLSEKNHTILKECEDVMGAIDNVHIIVMSKQVTKGFKLTLAYVSEKVDKHWCFIHKLPRGHEEVASEIFNHNNSLVWESKANLQWIYAALMVRLLRHYEHVSEIPKFDKTSLFLRKSGLF